MGRQCNLTSSSLLVESFTAFSLVGALFRSPQFPPPLPIDYYCKGRWSAFSLSLLKLEGGGGKIKVNICDVISVALLYNTKWFGQIGTIFQSLFAGYQCPDKKIMRRLKRRLRETARFLASFLRGILLDGIVNVTVPVLIVRHLGKICRKNYYALLKLLPVKKNKVFLTLLTMKWKDNI